MPGIGAISGKSGNCLTLPIGGTGTGTEIAELTKWSFNPKCNNPAWASNRTAGFKRRRAGIRDGSGSIEGKWDPGDPITDHLEDGTEVQLNLVTTGAQQFTVPAIIDGLKLDVDLDSGDIIGWSADWSLNGAWTKPTLLTAFAGPIAGGDGANAFAGQAPQSVLAQQAPQGQPQVQGSQLSGSPEDRQRQAIQAAQQGPQQAPQGHQGFDPQQMAQVVAQAVLQALGAHPAFVGQQQPQPSVVARPAA
jgi:hypothetical protein